jgi:predicted TIM-barrel fold metal-dependent hydrolase
MTTTAITPPPQPPPSPVLAPAKQDEYNRLGLDFYQPMPRPKVRGRVIDAHCHLLAARHAKVWFETAEHYGIDDFITMSPLEEALGLARDWPGRLQFIAVPKWGEVNYDDWMRRIDGFYNIGSRIVKFHMAPGTMQQRQWRLDTPQVRKIIESVVARNMIVMTHLGDPETWYQGKYTDTQKFGTREEHYRMWEAALASIPQHPWLGAHMGGNPEDLPRLQSLLDRFPNLYLDCSATRWMVREISARRDAAREFFIRNQDRIIFGSDQVSFDDRGFDFLASRWWCHRKLWETAYIGPSPIFDPDLPPENQPTLRGLALPDGVLQKVYHDNAVKLLARVGVHLA